MKTSTVAKIVIAASAVLSGLSCFAEGEKGKISIDGSTTVGPIAKAFADFYKENHEGVNITISESGSGNGVKSLMNSACDIAAMSRFMKPAEFKSCVDKGIMPVAHVIAFDAIAIAVNPENKVSALSIEQIADIYSGKITNWKEVGGDDAKIVVISRDTNSGTYETFGELVMKKTPVGKDAEYVGSNGQARSRVNSTKYAIAYVGLGFADNTVKVVSVNGIIPDLKSVASGKYPLARPLYLFTNAYPKMGSIIYDFVNLHLSKEGREIVKDLGFVPVCE